MLSGVVIGEVKRGLDGFDKPNANRDKLSSLLQGDESIVAVLLNSTANFFFIQLRMRSRRLTMSTISFLSGQVCRIPLVSVFREKTKCWCYIILFYR